MYESKMEMIPLPNPDSAGDKKSREKKNGVSFQSPNTVSSEDQDLENEPLNLKEDKEPRISCCYKIMVFIGLAISLSGLTVVVIYAGFWSNYGMLENDLLIIIGGDINGDPQDLVTVHILPGANARCKTAPPYPIAVSGSVGIVMTTGLTVCGGLLKSPRKNVSLQTVGDCYRLDSAGWNKVEELKHSRAFAASAYFPGRGWWITGGVSHGIEAVLGLESPLTSTELIPIEDDERGEEYKFLVDEPNLPVETGLSHHCLVRLDKYRVLLIGGQTNGNTFVSDVWLFDWKRRKWDRWTDLRYGRHSHACSLALGGEFIVVAGGESEHEDVHGRGSQLAEIMEITTGHWHIMPQLPKPMWGGAFVSINYLPTLIGGATSDDSLTIQLMEKGEFRQSKLMFNPGISIENTRKYATALVSQEKFVCF